MERLSIEQAEHKLFDLLYSESIEDRLYELAQDLFNRSVRKLEEEYEVEDLEFLESDAEWYDDSYDEFIRQAFGRMSDFLTATV